jgi:hypothetical protein
MEASTDCGTDPMDALRALRLALVDCVSWKAEARVILSELGTVVFFLFVWGRSREQLGWARVDGCLLDLSSPCTGGVWQASVRMLGSVVEEVLSAVKKSVICWGVAPVNTRPWLFMDTKGGGETLAVSEGVHSELKRVMTCWE